MDDPANSSIAVPQWGTQDGRLAEITSVRLRTEFVWLAILAWPDWKSPVARVCSRQKPATWSHAAIPKPVKHRAEL
jgi:hypothetical protein